LYGIQTGEQQDLVSSSRLEPEVSRPHLDAQLVPLRESLALIGKEVTSTDLQWLRGLLTDTPQPPKPSQSSDASESANPRPPVALDPTHQALFDLFESLSNSVLFKLLSIALVLAGIAMSVMTQRILPALAAISAALMLPLFQQVLFSIMAIS